jgi:hypothetical protein
MGKSNIDDHSLEELKKFQVLVLSGYNYRNKNTAFDLLEKYAQSGGSVFIDTGWQYNNPNWEGTKLPKIFPTNSVSWQTLGLRTKMQLVEPEYIKLPYESKNIGDTTIVKTQWGISGANDVRIGSHVILQTSGVPVIMAKKEGKGRVVWSGINIITHIEGGHNENQKEIEMLNGIYKWLLNEDKNKTYKENASLHITRTDPDSLKFGLKETINTPSTLYWREAFHPKWHAQLKSKNRTTNIPIYRAGPRMMGMLLPPTHEGDIVQLKVTYTFEEIIVLLLTIFGTITLLLHIANIPYKVWTSTINRIKSKLESSRIGVIEETRRNKMNAENE